MKKPPIITPIFLFFLLNPGHSSPDEVFEFTESLYNLSLEENSVGTKYARSETATKIGVPLPEKDANCKFRIAEVVGEKSSLFKANAKQVGDFVFLRVRYKGDNPLNRELKDFYDILVKATCKRKDSSNLETTARVHLRVIDRNDASPVFLVDEQGYEVEIDDSHDKFSPILQVEASDADIGMNSQIYYSLVNTSHEFFVEPVSGWIRSLRHVRAGEYFLKVKAEDRTSRLYYFDENEVQPSWTADVKITVRKTDLPVLKVSIESRNLSRSNINQRQLAAVISLKDAETGVSVGLKDNFLSHWFEIEEGTEDKWMLFARPHSIIPNGTNVTLSIGSNHQDPNLQKSPQNITKLIHITYSIDHSITFTDNEPLNLKISDQAPIGHVIARFPVVLGHPEDESLVRYSIDQGDKITDKNTSLPLSIGARNGILKVKTKLKGSGPATLTIKVSASISRSRNVSRIVIIEVITGNNHSPVWAAKWMRQAPIAISTSKNPGDTLVKMDAMDQDEGNNGRVVYKLSSEDPLVPITIDANSGVISLSEWPQGSKKTSWPVTVWAIDMGIPVSRRSAINLVFYKNGTKIPPKPKQIIIPEPANKNSPVFTSFPDLLEVTEDAPIGTIIAKLQAEDADHGFNGLVRYLIDSPKTPQFEVLSVDEITGEIAVASDLTKLMKPKMEFVDVELKVTATDSGDPAKTSVKNMKLRIRDVNNNSPIFSEPSYQLKISEAEKVGKEILKVLATDLDSGESVRYQLADKESVISIDSQSGVIKLRKQLDREQQDVHHITIIATDKEHLSFVNFTLIVEDVNDNAPRCTQPITKVQIPSDLPHEAFVGCISASDSDNGRNAKLKFSLSPPLSAFRVDHHSGCIFVHAPEKPFNYHETPQFNLSIEVADNGEPVLSTTCQFQVGIVNVALNHQILEFDDVAKEASVYENSELGTEVIMVEAKEGSDDKRKADNIKYTIIGGDGWPYFTIGSQGTVKTSAPLDREAKASYWISVEASDSDDMAARRSAVLHIFIRVLDRNDHRPVARKPIYTAQVLENSPADVVVVKVEATDADDPSAPLTFKIEKGDPQSFFRIDLTSGYITTSGLRRLDREKQSEHELWVLICDGGEPQLCSNVVVIVEVLDENDNAPAFNQLIYHFSVRTDFVGAICRVFAVDADSDDNGRLFYNITEGESRFSIDENGTISTSEPIHGDESYALTVQATDRGTPSQFSASRVVLTASGAKKPSNSTNHGPLIAGKKADYVIPISDADQVGLTVGKLEASDEDGDDLWWSISSGNEDFVFDIRQDTGQILLAKKVENLKTRELKLNVSVTDGLLWDHSTVLIQASQQVTKRPKFSAGHYQTMVSEKVAVGTQIYTLKATGEALTTKPLIFSMFSVDDIAMEDKLRVEPSSGNVIVMEALDYETAKRIQGVVQVQQANMKSFATFTVDVNDENDNPPQFVQHSRRVTVDERSPPGTLITTVKAFDKDSSTNSLITYSIISGNEESLFQINAESGEIRLSRPLEGGSEWILRLRASDSSPRSLKDEMILHIGNGKSPEDNVSFEKSTYQVTLNDDTPPGTPIVVPTVLTHSHVTYGFRDNCTYFGVHTLSGAVHLKRWLTELQTKTVECQLTVLNSQRRRDEAKISVKIQKTNQKAPVFRSQVYRGSIRENSPAGSVVLDDSYLPLVITADDEDSGASGLLEYRILGDNSLFSIDKYSGLISALSPLDFEHSQEHQFHVQAFDFGVPRRRSLMPTLIIISVLDDNDVSPEFPEKSIDTELLLPTASGVLIGGQRATDKDTVGVIRYFIKDPRFDVDASGDVRVKDSKVLKPGSLSVEVFASDSVRSTSYTMNILISDPKDSDFRFTQDHYQALITENTTYQSGAIISSVATINDKGHVEFRILNPHNAFFIHPATGVLSATGVMVDREISPLIRLIIQARTLDQKAQSVITIQVEDVNDNSPIFMETPYDTAISLNSEVGTLVIRVQATDKDSGDHGRIQYSSEDLPEAFELRKNGSIYLKKKLSEIQEFQFHVEARDSSVRTLEPVRVRVVDGSRPIFEQHVYTARIPRGTLKNAILAKVTAKSNVQRSENGGFIGYRLITDKEEPLISVDFETGEIRLLGDPKFMEDSEVEVEAVEVTKPHLTSTALLRILMVTSSSEAAPEFQKESYEVRIPESAALGQKLITINISDKEKKLEPLEYSMDSEDFRIDSVTGDVFVAKPLDFETRQHFKLKVFADKGSTELHVYLDDVNDEKPVFLSDDVKAHVYDSAAPGQFITIMSATDLDTVSSLPGIQKLLFRIVDGDESLFNISPDTGEIQLARAIEPEDLSGAKTVKTLNISVTDGMFTAFAKLSVDILRNGAMQLPLRFEQSQYVASALENTIVNKSALLTVSAKNGILPFRYSLGSPSSSPSKHKKPSWPVIIDPLTGRIHVSRVLDFHHDKFYRIPLVVEDATGRRAFSTLTLTVIDINDKPPVFVSSSYSTSISETAKKGDTVLMVSATDDDENDMIEYTLLDGSEATFFSVHPRQGTVTVIKKLAHKAGVTFSLTIKATDSANPPHHATTVVDINVASETLKIPRFSNSHYLFEVPEDSAMGTLVGRVQQVESDIDEVRFTVMEAPVDLPFSVERSTGKIVVKSGLDRERRKQWKMAIRVDAAGGVHSMTAVTVDISDVNDNAPAFHGDYEKLTISEDAEVGTSVTIFSAIDKDDSPAGLIRFSLVKENEQFSMNEHNGWLTVARKLDREGQDSYQLIARATDEGGFSTDLPFQIQVRDVNDSPPKFEKSEFIVEIDKASDKTLPIITLNIQDADLSPNNHSQLFISSGNEQAIFLISDNGDIRIQRPDLLLLSSNHSLTITAFDGVFRSQTKVLIRVTDKQALIKCPQSPVIVKVLENSKKGTLVLEDPKIPGVPEDVTYELTSESWHPFVVNFRNGVIKVKEDIDFEKNQYFEIARKSTKDGNVICVEPLTIRVLNVNDNQPEMAHKTLEASIKENLETSPENRHYLTTVKARDLDGDVLKFKLDSDHDGKFMVDERSGVLTVVKALDSEEQAEFNLTVVVSDGKWEDRALIHLLVIDQNDNAPTFEKSVYSIKVMESESVGYELAHFRASGGDANESIEFSLLESPVNKYFHLDRDSGVMKLAEPLDFEEIDRYELTVIAKDSGVPPLSSEAKVNIIIMDENDNAPVFEKEKYIGRILENSKPGTMVIKVKATDKDKEHFGSVSYQLEPIDNDKEAGIPFVITDNGEIKTLDDSIDFEKRQIYNLKVIAKDGGLLTSEALLEIHVDDVNDNPPLFDDCNMTAIVQEGAPIGHSILKFGITDKDGPDNRGPYKLLISGEGSTSFGVTEDLRMVTTKKLSAKKDRFLLTVVAKDVKGRGTDCPLTVYIRKESRHAPVIRPMMIRVNTLQNELPAGIIGRLRASDEDKEDVLKFGIVEGSVKGPLATLDTPKPPSGRPHGFRVDPNTGDVWADHSIPPGLHAFNVTVSDGKFTPISFVEVHVISIDSDVIDHAVSIRIRSMTIQEFMTSFVRKFRKLISHYLNLDEESIMLISVQEVSRDTDNRARRSDSDKDVEILMALQRGHSRGFLKPDHVYTRLKADFPVMNQQNEGMRFQLITEMCTTGVCLRGECRESIELIETNWTKVSTDHFSFVSPLHSRSAQCLCPDGFGGDRCETEVNQCSKSPCSRHQICVPQLQNASFECVCPLGMGGAKCATPTCSSHGKCLEEAELSVGGHGFFEIFLANEVETRMELEIEMRTTTGNGVIMRTTGRQDYHQLILSNGSVEYHWDAGSGSGIVKSRIPISDGEWHRVAISRRQRRTRMTVDDVDVQESFSPLGSTVLNLHRFSQKLVIGANVKDSEVTEGISACFKGISIDGRKIPKTRQGMKLYGAQPGCSALTSSPCNDMPCKNGGTCSASGQEFVCSCPSRYSGNQCEIDLEPCASHPCPTGIQCIPFFNDYLCKCPDGFTGKHCESRGFDDSLLTTCPKEACGSGQCISIPRHNQNSDFICNCTGGILQTEPCSDRNTFASILELLFKAEIILVLLGLCFLLLVCCIAVVVWKCCKKNQDPKYGAHCDVPHMRNTRVLMPTTDPPPLPPRGLRGDFPTSRPMVQVRPFVNNPVEARPESSSKPSDKFRRPEELSNRMRRSDRIDRNDALTPLRDSPDMCLIDERIGSAALKYRPAAGLLVIGDTELAPVINDDDYMTMKPRKDTPPQVPAHRGQDLLYDDPIDDIDEEVDIHIS